MKRLTIDIFDEEDGRLIGLIDMNSNELRLSYGNTTTMHGLQCNFDGNTKEYNAILEKVEQIANLIRELDKICK